MTAGAAEDGWRQVTGAHGCLLDEFLWPETNHRTDARIAGDPGELEQIRTVLADAGVFHASQRRFWEPAFPGSALNLAAGEYDLVAAGRILLGNPAWARLPTEDRLSEVDDYVKAHEETYH
ncbi:MAG TPA: hypothetical protein VN408_02940 [Actinoplanes sp.]|nr:hypothetical protein [Actinoplanes sp.]